MTVNTEGGRGIAGRGYVGIIGAIVCSTMFALSLGLSYPLLSFILTDLGYSQSAIGFNAAMTPLGVLCASPFLPRLVKRYGSWQIGVASLLTISTLIVVMGFSRNYTAFVLLRFILGMADAGVFIVSETWVNQLAKNRSRGRIVGIYATALSAGLAAGPLALSLTGVESLAPFFIGSACCFSAAILIFWIRHNLPNSTREAAASSWSFFKLAPTLLIAVAVFSFWDAVLLALFPVYGLKYGLSASFIAFAMGICIAGNTALQIPLGWVADHTSRRFMLIVCAVFGTLGSLLIPFLIDTQWLLLPVFFFWGAFAGGLYTMAMTELGDRFTGSQLVAGNAAFAIAYGLGGLVAGPITGIAMDLFGQNGFSGTLALVFAFTAAVAWWRSRQG